MKNRRAFLVAWLALVAGAGHAWAQRTVTVPTSTRYERSELWEVFFGDTWRDAWRVPITMPVLNLATYAGGLEPYQAGGNQSRTLRFRGGDGRIYMFRSSNKDVQRKALPDDLRHTPIGAVIQDQTSSMHPSGSLVVAVLQEAVDLLHAPPTLVLLPDDPRLGEFRAEFANMVGQIEERPEDADEAEQVFAGADDIDSAETLLENLEESMSDQLDSREYLIARLIDFIVGDTDRGADQWRFAVFEKGDLDRYRPIPRDRDYAFMESGGLLIRIGAMIYPKLTNYGDHMPKLRTLVFMTREFDRSHLVDISPAAWDSIVAFVQRRLTDEVIARAVAQMPPQHRALTGEEIESGLRSRRDDLKSIAREYYLMVNEDADIFASAENERAEIDRHADGSVTVRIWREGAGGEFATDGQQPPTFTRHFVPAETQEIRVYLERGDDRAIVRGRVERSIEVRIVGGEDDDVLIDSSVVARGDQTHFYDAHGDNTIVAGAHTRIIRTPFVTTPPKCSRDQQEECEEEGEPRVLSEERRGRWQDLMNDEESFLDEKIRSEAMRTWGKHASWDPLLDYGEGNGVVLGLGRTITDYGFRRRPYEAQVTLGALVGTTSGRLGLQLSADRYFETAPLRLSMFAHATQLEANRFFGFGNHTPLIDQRLSLVRRDELLVSPELRLFAGGGTELWMAPTARYTRARPAGDSPALGVVPTDGFGQVGARAGVSFDRSTITHLQQRGFAFELSAAGYPAAWDVTEGFGSAAALARFYLPLGASTLAFRAGGQRVWGSFPLHEAAFVGGSSTLRGYTWNRFAGDAAAYGSTELRVPLTRITLLTRGELGVLGFADAGRVWLDGESDGGWHTSYGGGLWFASLGHAISVSYAKGEEGRFYISLGQAF
ncbi:MAG: BamA/TamA family outer membrane protein [Gemmatimonadota bacterium]